MSLNPVSGRHRTTLAFLGLHALLYLGLYQVGYTPQEWADLNARATAAATPRTRFVLEHDGAWGLLRAYYRTDSDERLYREYALLTLTGSADLEYIRRKQYRTEPFPATAGRAWPYRDVRIEYPPLALLVAIVPAALVATSYEGYRVALAGLLLLVHLATVWACLQLVDARDPRQVRRLWLGSLLFCFLLGNIVATRMDGFVACTLIVTVLCLERSLASSDDRAARLARLAGAVCAVGVLIKIVPVLMAAVAVAVLWGQARNDRKRLTLEFVGATALTVAGVHLLSWVVLGNGYLDTFSYHAARGIQLESTYASVLLVLRWFGAPLQLELAYGSSNVASATASILARLTPVVFAGLAGLQLLTVYRTRSRDVVVAAAGLVSLFVLTNKVFSPQYLIWLMPLVLVHAARAKDDRTLALLLAAALLSQVLYPRLYSSLKAFHPLMVSVLVVRNAVVLALAVVLWRALRAFRPDAGTRVGLGSRNAGH